MPILISELPLSGANGANVPVNVSIEQIEETTWELAADNYQPRRCSIVIGCYVYRAETKEELLELVQKYIIPLYRVALEKLGKEGELYYWNKD